MHGTKIFPLLIGYLYSKIHLRCIWEGKNRFVGEEGCSKWFNSMASSTYISTCLKVDASNCLGIWYLGVSLETRENLVSQWDSIVDIWTMNIALDSCIT